MAFKLLCVLALAAVATAAPGSRLSGASEITIRDAPYAVSIVYTYPGPNITIQRCAGSLISSWHVLTSAYCFRGANIQNMLVRAGSTDSLNGGVVSAVSRFVIHPDYEQAPRTNDIAVLFVAQQIGITQDVGVLYLPPQGYPVPTGSEVTVVGWGFSQDGGPQLPNLHEISLTTVSQDSCQVSWAEYEDVLIDENTMCAADAIQGICDGDSGAPLVQSNVILGIASYFDSCGGDRTRPDLFTHVPNFTPWILSVATAPMFSEGTPVRVAEV